MVSLGSIREGEGSDTMSTITTKRKKGKKRGRHHESLPWQSVTVGLAEPSSSETNHYDSDDGEQDLTGDQKRKSSKKNSNKRIRDDLEEQPNEDVGMFYGLEVIDGSQYTVETRNDTKYMVMHGSQSDTNTDMKNDVAQIEAKPSSTADEPIKKTKKPKKKKQQKLTTAEESIPSERTNTKKAKAKKTKQTKNDDKGDSSTSSHNVQKKAQSEEMIEVGNETSTATAAESSSSGPKKKKRKKKKKSKASKATTEQDSIAATSTTKPQHEQDKNTQEQIQALQTSWTVATGGVVLDESLCYSLLQQNFWTPTPIQSATLPAALLGRRNVVGAAATGSGKTLAYMLPILQYLIDQQNQKDEASAENVEQQKQPFNVLQALVLTPTRELALQVSRECDKLIPKKKWVGSIIGGLAEQKQHRILEFVKPPILVATPGRLWELMSTGEHAHLANLERIKFLVIDEADRMVNQGSYPQLSKILDAVHNANPLDEDEEDLDDCNEDDLDDPDRLLGLPGIPGEAKVRMLNDDILQQLQHQRGGDNDGDTSDEDNEDDVPEPMEMDDEEFHRLQAEQEVDMEDHQQHEDEELSLPPPPPVQRQTFIYSATLTLLPSPEYKPKQKKKKSKNKKGKAVTVEGAIAEILEKARAGGETKVVDLTSDQKSFDTNKSKSAAKNSSKADRVTHDNIQDATETGLSKRLPPGLTLRQIECTQRHKDSHLYAYLITTVQGTSGPCLVFCNSIAAVRRVGATLQALRLPVRTLHANMPQKARFKALESIRRPQSRDIVVATDVASRGLDIPSVSTVIHYDVARATDTFVHRAGRTARGMGEKAVGSSLSLVSAAEERAQENICEALGSKRLFENGSIDGRLLTLAQERVSLASKIVTCDSEETKTQKQNKWYEQAAEEAGLDLDEDLLEDGLAGGDERERQKLHQAKAARAQLRAMLAVPMQTQRFGKFLSVNSAVHNDKVTPYVVQDTTGHKKSKRNRKKRKAGSA